LLALIVTPATIPLIDPAILEYAIVHVLQFLMMKSEAEDVVIESIVSGRGSKVQPLIQDQAQS